MGAHRNRSRGLDLMDCARIREWRYDAASALRPGGNGEVAEPPPPDRRRTAAA